MAQKKSILLATLGFGLCLVMSVLFQSAPAYADQTRARELYVEGYSYYKKQAWRQAGELFYRSYGEEKHSLTALMLAASSHKIGDARGTQTYARDALRVMPPLKPPQERWARALLASADDYFASNTAGLEGKADELGSGSAMTPVNPAVPPLQSRPAKPKQRQLSGVYTIRQKSNGRYVDAHVTSNNDFSLVTRPRQNNDTQRWIIRPLGNNVYTIRQKSNGRYVDAHEAANNNFRLVTRPRQNNDTQRWLFRKR